MWLNMREIILLMIDVVLGFQRQLYGQFPVICPTGEIIQGGGYITEEIISRILNRRKNKVVTTKKST